MILRKLTTLFLALGLVVLSTGYGRADVENDEKNMCNCAEERRLIVRFAVKNLVIVPFAIFFIAIHGFAKDNKKEQLLDLRSIICEVNLSTLVGRITESPDAMHVAWISKDGSIWIDGRKVSKHFAVIPETLQFGDPTHVWFWALERDGFYLCRVSIEGNEKVMFKDSSLPLRLRKSERYSVTGMPKGTCIQMGFKHVFLLPPGLERSNFREDRFIDPWVFISPSGSLFKIMKYSDYLIGKHSFDNIWVPAAAFSKDNKRFFCALKESHTKNWYAMLECLPIKGKRSIISEGPYGAVGRPEFSPNGRHLVYMAKHGNSVFLVINGKEREIPRASSVGECVINNKGLVAYEVRIEGKSYVYVEGKPVSEKYDEIAYLSWSPNGTRLAYMAEEEKKWFYVIDQKKGVSFNDCARGIFDSESQHFAYCGKRDEKWLIVSGKRIIDPHGILMPELYLGKDMLRYIVIQNENQIIRNTVNLQEK